jgi:microcystin-dependent protein
MRFHILLAAAAAALASGVMTTGAAAQAPPAMTYVGEVRAFAFNFCPSGWLPADGRNMAIAQNQTLFSLLGTSFGGNGFSVFNLPDLRGRAPIGAGPSVTVGQIGGGQPGPQPLSLGMTWCIAVQGTVPQNLTARPRRAAAARHSPQ